jgi:hypothetical protein
VVTPSARFDGLVNRRQFILGPETPRADPAWTTTKVAGRFSMASHADLPVTQAAGGGVELTLVGVMLDPDAPERSDSQVVKSLLPAAIDEDALHHALGRMGGRWALFVAPEGGEPYVFHDPCGLRQIVHAATHDGVWCASEPLLLARQLSLAADPTAMHFLNSPYARSYKEFWWPGMTTPFLGAAQLLPNHALELTTGTVRRYWPKMPWPRRSLGDAAAEAAHLLRGIVEAAAYRFPLAFELTAGVDSRTVLAAGRRVVTDAYVYTLTNPHLGFVERDAAVAERLTAVAGVTHHRIACPSTMGPEFAAFYRSNTATAHETWGATVEALLSQFPPERVALSGSCSEISRRGYRRIHPVDRAGLARLENMVTDPFPLAAIEDWLADALQIPFSSDEILVELYYWEARMGRWLGSAHSEFDVVQETLAPFNCRAVAETLLGVDIPDRDPPASLVHKRIIELLWPDLLAIPFNPMTRVQAAKARVKARVNWVLRATHAYDGAKSLQLQVRARVRGATGHATHVPTETTIELEPPNAVDTEYAPATVDNGRQSTAHGVPEV